MHEIAIVEGLIELIGKQKERHQFARVVEIRINCGKYNCASEENLNFCLKTAAAGTYLENALIKVNRLPERWECPSCKTGIVKENEDDEVRCPKCGSAVLVPLLNSEIYLDKLEVE
jgi:hydrogenase nickel insertion protein HypA